MPSDIGEVAGCDTVGNEQVEGTTVIKQCKQKKEIKTDDGKKKDESSEDLDFFNGTSSEEDSYHTDEDLEIANNPYKNIRPYDGRMWSNCSIIEGTKIHSHFWFTVKRRQRKKKPCNVGEVTGGAVVEASDAVVKEQVEVEEKTQGTAMIKQCEQKKGETEEKKIKNRKRKKRRCGPRLQLDKHLVKPELFSTDPDEQAIAMMKQCSRCYSIRRGDPWGLKCKKKQRIWY